MSIYLGRLEKYWKNQKPIDFLIQDDEFYDQEFKPEDMIFSKNEEKNLEYLKEMSKGFQKSLNLPDNAIIFETKEDFLKILTFKRLSELDLEIFDDKIDCSKFRQGLIGNCYFIDAISNLSNCAQILTQLFRIDKKNKIGYYEICFFIEGEWQVVIIDDIIPFIQNDIFFTSAPLKGCKCCYFILLEKAWAKINGSYIDSIGGFAVQAYEALTGFVTDMKNHKVLLKVKNDQQKEQLIKAYSPDDIDKIFQLIYEGIREYGYFFSAGSEEELLNTERHSFSLINADIHKYSDNENIRAIQLRNPHGENKQYIVKNGKLEERTLKHFLPNYEKSEFLHSQLEQYINEEDNGLFWTDIKNYLNYFYPTSVCYSMLGANVHSIKFTNKEKSRDYNVFNKTDGNLYFKLHLNENARIIVGGFFNDFSRKKETKNEVEFECIDINNKENLFKEEEGFIANKIMKKKGRIKSDIDIKKGDYLIIGKFHIEDISKFVSLVVNLYSLNNVEFRFITDLPPNGYTYKQIYGMSQEMSKRIQFKYKYCEDLREKFLYHKTLIKFFKEKLGCEFTLSGKGFYIDSLENDKVDCLIRIDKTKKRKFGQVVVSQKKDELNNLSNQI